VLLKKNNFIINELIYYDIYVNKNVILITKDCISAIDGTHVPAKVTIDIISRFCGRYKQPTQNVLASIRFDMRFSYVLASWEGTANDYTILRNALDRPNRL
jgi:hypothetical protein